jgi:hypothetical protein
LALLLLRMNQRRKQKSENKKSPGSEGR